MRIRISFFIILILVIVCGVTAYAKIITIPGDAKSIQEAVELAASGDEIIVNATEVEWGKRILGQYNSIYHDSRGVRIEDKNVVITGVSPSGKTSITCFSSNTYNEANTMLFVKNSNVRFKNFYVRMPFKSRYMFNSNGGPVASPLYVESGYLEINDCDLTCWMECHGNLTIQNSIIHGYAWLQGYAYVLFNLQDPSILFGSSTNSKLEIINSNVSSDTSDGFRNIIVDNVENSEIILKQSHLAGSPFHVGYGSSPADLNGSDGLKIQNSKNVRVDVENCIFKGGKGYDATLHRFRELQGGGNGGSGFSITDSTVEMHIKSSSIMQGGDGGTGGVYKESDSPPEWGAAVVDAGNGGNGMTLTNSVVTVFSDSKNFYQAFGGKKGGGTSHDGYTAKDGVDGLPFYMDENSKWISNSPISEWAIFQ